MVFIGQKYTYLITEGSEPFYALLKEFPADKLILASDNPISLEFYNATQFQDMIKFNYADPVENLTPQQISRLKQLGFRSWKAERLANGKIVTYMQASYYYRGELYQSVETNQIHHRFSKPYPLALIQVTTSTHINAGNIGKTIILTPLALTFDIITAPLFGAFILSCSFRDTACIELK